MKLILLGVLFSIIGLGNINATDIKSTERYIKEPNEVVLYIQEEIKPQFEYKVDREVAIEEVIDYWNHIFDSAGANKDDWRRSSFHIHAESLVDSVRYYQNTLDNEEILLPQNRRLYLPNGRYTHLLVAYIVYRESSVNPNVIGKKFGEVGLMQLHGNALNGYSKKAVRQDPALGLRLGVRWLSVAYTRCRNKRLDNLLDWKGPLALYGSKPKNVLKENGICKTNFGFANERVNHVRSYVSNVIEI